MELLAAEHTEEPQNDAEQRDGSADREPEPASRYEHRADRLRDQPQGESEEQADTQSTPPENARRDAAEARRLPREVQDIRRKRRAPCAAHSAKRLDTANDDGCILSALWTRPLSRHGAQSSSADEP